MAGFAEGLMLSDKKIQATSIRSRKDKLAALFSL